MGYSERLAARVRGLLSGAGPVAERRMFGGLTFMVRGHMCCGIQGERLMARVGPDRYDDALRWPHAKPMDFTGKPIRGFLYVQPAGLKTAAQLRRWVGASLAYVQSVPRKTKKRRPRGSSPAAVRGRRAGPRPGLRRG